MNYLCFHTFMISKIHPLQDIASCMAWDKLVELEKTKILHVEEAEVVLNYEKTLVVVAYHFNIEGLLELNAEAPTFYQVRHVAQTPVIAAPVALRETFVVR